MVSNDEAPRHYYRNRVMKIEGSSVYFLAYVVEISIIRQYLTSKTQPCPMVTETRHDYNPFLQHCVLVNTDCYYPSEMVTG